MISMTFALLQAEGGAMGSYGGIIMIVALFAIMYFFMIRPQNLSLIHI